MLRSAVIGTGSMGQNHVRIYRNMDRVHLAAVADSDESAAKRLGSLYGVQSYGNVDEMLDRERIDLVSLAVPTDRHYSVGMKLLERGIHVLIEKPIAQTVEQGRELVECAARFGCVLAIGHVERFNPAVVELHRRISQTEVVGPVYKITTQRLSPYPPRIKDVGVVIDLATHDINLMTSLMSGVSIKSLYAQVHRSINASNGKEDLFHGVLRFANGAIGTLDVDWMTPKKVRRVSVTTANGLFECDTLSQELFFYENASAGNGWDSLSVLRGVTEGNMQGIRIQRQEPLALELADFVDSVEKRRSPVVTGEDGLETLSLAMRFLESAGADIGV